MVGRERRSPGRAHALQARPAADLKLRLPTSVFKSQPGNVVLGVQLQLRRGERSEPIRYAELAAVLDVRSVHLGAAGPAPAALALRRRRGWRCPYHDTWSAARSSPTRVRRRRCRGHPTVPTATSGRAPLAIEHGARGLRRAGWAGRALSGKHALALTNRGGARRTCSRLPVPCAMGSSGVRRSPRPGAGARRLHRPRPAPAGIIPEGRSTMLLLICSRGTGRPSAREQP